MVMNKNIKENKYNKQKAYRVCDFFCGSGGFSEGFRQAGFDIVFAVDNWEPAVTTYKANNPSTYVLQEDIIKLSKLSDEEFDKIIPDTEIIIGSPPCQSFSRSNKSGKGDKKTGIELIEAYLRIIARKKYKKNSSLKYWVLENVPGSINYIKEKYSAKDLDINDKFILVTNKTGSGIYNAKYFGAPTNRIRYFCGEFPAPIELFSDDEVKTLGNVLSCLGNPIETNNIEITDINYPTLKMFKRDITDMSYVYELAEFEWETSKRLKLDRGYMGKMSFPENLNKPARTVMATMSSRSREAMILPYGNESYRLPTVREAATIMSFPIDYRFYGKTKATKHTLVGNAVPPKISYAIAVAIASACNIDVPSEYIPIKHDEKICFYNLNGKIFQKKKEKEKRLISKFKYHIPYTIINAYRMELTNYHSLFDENIFVWSAEIHYSQGKKHARIYTPNISSEIFDNKDKKNINKYINNYCEKYILSNLNFQKAFCSTKAYRNKNKIFGPFEMLQHVKDFLDTKISNNKEVEISTEEGIKQLPYLIVVGYYIIKKIIEKMEEEK